MAEAIFLGPLAALGSGKQFRYLNMQSNPEDLEFLRDRLADARGKVVIQL